MTAAAVPESIRQARQRPRRTLLYVSADIQRHIDKAPQLPTDAIIYDLHESIAAEFKERGRQRLRLHLLEDTPHFRGQERILRVNPLHSEWFADDLALAAALPIDAVLFTGISGPDEMRVAAGQLKRAIDDEERSAKLPLMAMIESPLAVLNAEKIAAADPRMACIIVSTANLATSMHLPPSQERTGLFSSLALVVLAARAHGIGVADGAHLDITEPTDCEYACRQSRDFGFDGKAVIHPVQLAYTNDAFTPKPKDLERKRRIIQLMEEARTHGRSYAMMDSRLLQPSELDAAHRCLDFSEAVAARKRAFEEE